MEPVQSAATSVPEYLASLSGERRDIVTAVRHVILDHLPEGFDETMQYGMISYVVPLERFRATYNGQPLAVVSLASQRRYLSLYLMGVYGDDGHRAWLEERWAAAGKKLDMGKSCLRFRRLEDLDLGIIGEAIERTSVDDLIAAHERAHTGRRR
jgi:hypothetical protein